MKRLYSYSSKYSVTQHQHGNLGVANGKIRDSPRCRDPCLKIQVLDSSDFWTKHEKKKPSLQDSVETLPRFRDQAKIFRDPRFSGRLFATPQSEGLGTASSDVDEQGLGTSIGSILGDEATKRPIWKDGGQTEARWCWQNECVLVHRWYPSPWKWPWYQTRKIYLCMWKVWLLNRTESDCFWSRSKCDAPIHPSMFVFIDRFQTVRYSFA